MSMDQISGVLAMAEGMVLVWIFVIGGGYDGRWPRLKWYERLAAVFYGWFVSVRGLDLMTLRPGGLGHVDQKAVWAWSFALIYIVARFLSILHRGQEPALRHAADKMFRDARALRRKPK